MNTSTSETGEAIQTTTSVFGTPEELLSAIPHDVLEVIAANRKALSRQGSVKRHDGGSSCWLLQFRTAEKRSGGILQEVSLGNDQRVAEAVRMVLKNLRANRRASIDLARTDRELRKAAEARKKSFRRMMRLIALQSGAGRKRRAEICREYDQAIDSSDPSVVFGFLERFSSPRH